MFKSFWWVTKLNEDKIIVILSLFALQVFSRLRRPLTAVSEFSRTVGAEQELHDVEALLAQLLGNICKHSETGAIAEMMKSDSLKYLWTSGAACLNVVGAILQSGQTMEPTLLRYMHQNSCITGLIPVEAISPPMKPVLATLIPQVLTTLTVCLRKCAGMSPSLLKQFDASQGYDKVR